VPITEGTQPAAKTWTGAWTTAQTTASFTPESGALLVALVSGDGAGGATPTTASVTDSLSGTWTLLKRQNTTTGTIGGTAEVWCRDSPGSSLTVSVTGSGAPANGGQLVVRTLIGAKAAASQTGATAGATLTAAAVQASVAAGTGGKIYGAAFNFTNSTNMTPLANTTVVSAFSDTTNGDSWEAYKSSADTAGTATYGYSTADDGMIAAAEILAAPAVPAVLPARPGRTWLRRFHHLQLLPPPAAAVVTAGPGGTVQPPATRQPRRAAARACWRGYVSATVNATPAAPVNGTVPLHLVVARRPAARGAWRGFTSTTTNLLNGAVQPAATRQPRRPAARAAWRGLVSSTANSAAVSTQVTQQLAWRSRPVPHRAVVQPPSTRTTNLPYGNPPGGAVRRRGPSRAVWAGTVSRTVNAAAAAPVNGTAPDHLVVARRTAARAVWAGTVSRTANFIPAPGTAPDHLVIARRAAARGLWRGNPAPGRFSRPVTSGLAKRRPPARGQWRGYVSRTVNTPPPPFTVGALTATDVSLAALAARTAAGGASGGTLTASDQRTGGPS